ncbi:MAG: hypothetical protein AAGA53_16365 [Pseudomonadota bacterium]
MSQVISPNFSKPDAKTRNLIQRMRRFDLLDRIELIENTFNKIVFKTRFSLADQVLLHALISSRANVRIVSLIDLQSASSTVQSLIGITKDLYGLALEGNALSNVDLVLAVDGMNEDGTEFIQSNPFDTAHRINPLADWSQEQLIDYVLAHEVPVNPDDMPGVSKHAA